MKYLLIFATVGLVTASCAYIEVSKSKDHVSLQYDPDADTPQMVEAVAVAACAESDREAKLIFRETSKAFGYNYAHYICQPE